MHLGRFLHFSQKVVGVTLTLWLNDNAIFYTNETKRFCFTDIETNKYFLMQQNIFNSCRKFETCFLPSESVVFLCGYTLVIVHFYNFKME